MCVSPLPLLLLSLHHPCPPPPPFTPFAPPPSTSPPDKRPRPRPRPHSCIRSLAPLYRRRSSLISRRRVLASRPPPSPPPLRRASTHSRRRSWPHRSHLPISAPQRTIGRTYWVTRLKPTANGSMHNIRRTLTSNWAPYTQGHHTHPDLLSPPLIQT